MPKIKISSKSLRQLFNGCDPDYIRNVCHARCCQSSTADTGIVVTIHPEEESAISARGGIIKNGLLQPNKGEKVCPFKNKTTHLCGLHFTPDKPFGCIASPFTLNSNDTLIVRNRYRLLKCYGDRHPSNKKIPAYKSFSASLSLIVGEDEARRISTHLDNGGGDISVSISSDVYEKLKTNDAIKKNMKTSNGKSPARCFGQDLMRGEHKVGESGLKTIGTTSWMQAKGLSGGCSDGDPAVSSGTSIFDPVLCELAYRWFCPMGGTVLDPFAGGSVRGVVASKLGLQYIGIELRAEQVDANRVQGETICADDDHPPLWHIGDSRNIASIAKGVEADLLFSCPPYADLEVYSDDPKDISTLGYAEFIAAYREIIHNAASLLKDDRFAVWVVGDVRDKKGFYQNFPGETINAFQDAGLILYNEAVLVTSVGSLPIRVGKQFGGYRKLGKTHQNVYAFYKGNPKNIKDIFGEVEVDQSFFDGAD